MLLSFGIIACLGISLSTQVSNGPCTADNAMWFVFDRQPCSKLLDSTDRLGIYKTRRERCEDPLTDCCVTCEKVRQEYACEDSLNGITLADGTYPCSKLKDANDRLGVYRNRLSICRQPETRCCVTCKDIGADCEQPNTGVHIADGSYPCSALLDPTDRLGIYKNRGKICDDKLTSCCITCETVRQELAENGTSSVTTRKPTPSTTLQTITGGNPVNQACERNVWIAGGAYECRYLLDTSNKYGIYRKRRDFCKKGIANCCVTCAKVLKETTSTPATVTTEQDAGYTVITTQKHVRKSTKKDCERSVWIADGSYDCSYLLDPSNKYDIYRNRDKFCKNGVASCCRTCAKVREEPTTSAPPSNIMAETSTGSSPVCKDEWIFIYNQYLECGRLTDTKNSFNIFRRREELCQLADTRCCKTCAQITQGTTVKPSGMKNMNENIINKPHLNQRLRAENTNIVVEPQTNDNRAINQQKMDAIHNAIQQGFLNFFRMFGQFQARAQQLNNGIFNRP